MNNCEIENPQYPAGYDWTWIGVDKVGNIAAFCTASLGPAPKELIKSHVDVILDIEDEVLKLPERSDVKLVSNVKRPDSFIDLANRGIFVFDWSDIHRRNVDALGAYELMAIPSKPLMHSQLPEKLVNVVKSAEFLNLDFSTLETFDPRVHLECTSAK